MTSTRTDLIGVRDTTDSDDGARRLSDQAVRHDVVEFGGPVVCAWARCPGGDPHSEPTKGAQ